jgi:hypothetical protein
VGVKGGEVGWRNKQYSNQPEKQATKLKESTNISA